MQTGNTYLILELTLQAEETKVLRLQLELSQAKADIERRLQEKEEELEASRWVFSCYKLTLGLMFSQQQCMYLCVLNLIFLDFPLVLQYFQN